jgi:antitoxin (DNA-binding transcriptional repressor) of toxin-antitoxin stability system
MKEIEVTTHEFKTHISSIIQRMKRGEMDRVIVKKNKKPVGVFHLHEDEQPKKRKIGFMQDKFGPMTTADWEAWDKLDLEIQKDFEESGSL